MYLSLSLNNYKWVKNKRSMYTCSLEINNFLWVAMVPANGMEISLSFCKIWADHQTLSWPITIALALNHKPTSLITPTCLYKHDGSACHTCVSTKCSCAPNCLIHFTSPPTRVKQFSQTKKKKKDVTILRFVMNL